MGRGFHIGNSNREPTVLKGNGNQLKNGYHRHHAIVFVGQDTTQHDAKHHAYQLQGDVAHRPPNIPFVVFSLSVSVIRSEFGYKNTCF